MAGDVMDQGTAGRYRTMAVRVGRYVPPPPADVSGLMFELLTWWNKEAANLSPVLSSAIVHYRFEAIHPFADGNGRTGRALALWELYRRGFDTHHIFSVDEFYWENRPRYYAALDACAARGRGFDAVAGILRRRFVADAGARLDTGAETFRPAGTGETGSAPEAGTAFAIAARPQEHDAARALGCAGRVQTGHVGFAPAFDKAKAG
jgi:hypothetical protein